MTPPPGRGIVEKLRADQPGVEDALPGEAAVADVVIALSLADLVNPRWLSALAGVLASLIIALNVFLLFEVFTG